MDSANFNQAEHKIKLVYGLEKFLKDTNKPAAPGVLPISVAQAIRPMVVCKDGFSLSIQASSGHYCVPAANNRTDYTELELGCLSEVVPELNGYMDPGSDEKGYSRAVFAYVPRELVKSILRKHGGISREKTLSESYLAEVKRIEKSMQSAYEKIDELQSLAKMFELLTKCNDEKER